MKPEASSFCPFSPASGEKVAEGRMKVVDIFGNDPMTIVEVTV